MHHVGFIVFILIIATVIAYAFIQYGLPQGFGTLFQARQAGTPPAAVKQQPAPTQVAAPSSAAPAQPAINPSEIPSGFTIRDLSPYFKKVSISASPGYSGSYSQISIYANIPSAEGTVDVTGWLLKGNRGSQYVPQGVAVYDPSGMTPESDINLKNGDVLTIYSTYQALGVNFRMNKCVGYLANTTKFNPPISYSCPAINRSEISNFTGQCQSYILSLGSCQMPVANPPVPVNDYGCSQYLNKLNYAGCFADHRNDYDFLSNQWYAWSGSQFLDFQHDRLLLFDRNGLLVAEYAY